MPKLKPKDPLAAVRSHPEKVKKLEINPADARNNGFEVKPLKAFPEEVLACKNLVSLEIFRGITGPVTIPDGIGKLRNLEVLMLGGLSLRAVPKAIGDLSKLKTLSLDYNASLAALPDTIGRLKNLETISFTDTRIRELPKALFDCKRLKRLDLRGIAKVPPGLGKLTNLEELYIQASALAGVGAEIGRLTKLKTLFVDGKGAVPAAVFSLSGVTTLQLRGLGLKELPPLGGLKKLVRLDISDNKLTSVSPAIASLPALEVLDFSGNPLPIEEKRIVDAMMKVSPAKRASKLGAAKPKPAAKAKTATKTKKAGARKAQPRPKAPRRFGSVVSENPSLVIRIGEKDSKKRPVTVSLDVGQGIAHVWAAGNDGRLAVTEMVLEGEESDMSADDRELFFEFIRAPLAKGAKLVGKFDIEDDDDWMIQLAPAKGDAEEDGVVVDVVSTSWKVMLEPEVRAAWGKGRRCLLVPA
ncbi:MAG: leucine-rich repeat domain-containing protein [Deltaproteobacteria bacterium]|nr:leucine-rich repeat domain-containing protein [Deltaproteobacteria bacterium]MBK8713482.1 leucine-rich repeat domain-containing protein [Deltaproteobacteria bacterium]MBP7288108.1 leucine-rich repeat domain-containing protein [Nannocystaceae bacterium]